METTQTRLSELINDSQIKVDIQVETFTDESGTHERSIVRRGREVWTEGKIIGKGSYGLVTLFTHQKRNGQAKVQAVKRIMKDSRLTGGVDFRKELDAILKFSLGKYEEFFVKCHGWYANYDCVFIVMEYLENGDLDTYMEQLGRSLPESEVKIITSQITQGIDLLHQTNFVHRDIKPANIFIASPGPNWEIKIGDFGITKRVKMDSSLRTTVGTRFFCAPEIQDIYPPGTREDSRYNYTEKVDLWSVGATAFYLLFHMYPFPKVSDLVKYVDRGAKLNFPSTPEVSKICYEFLGGTMAPAALARLSAIEAIEHGWLNDDLSNPDPNTFALDALAISSTFHGESDSLNISPKQNQAEREPDEGTTNTWAPYVEHRVEDEKGNNSRGSNADTTAQQASSQLYPSQPPLTALAEGWLSPSQPESNMELNHPIEISESFGGAGPGSDFQSKNKDSPWQQEAGLLIDSPRSLENAPLSQTLKSGLDSYVNDLKNDSITTNQLIDLRFPLSINESAKIFIELQGHIALANAFDKINRINTWSSPSTCITAVVLSPEDMQHESEIARCLWTLVQHPEGVNEALKSPDRPLIFALINGLIAYDISARQYATQALISILHPGTYENNSEQKAHVVLIEAMLQIEPSSKTRRCNLWISNVSFGLSLLPAEGKISPRSTRDASQEYLIWTMKLVNLLVEIPGSNKELLDSARKMFKQAGIRAEFDGFFDKMLKFASRDLEAQILRSYSNGLSFPMLGGGSY